MNYTRVLGESNEHVVIVYSLSTCPHCTDAKNYFMKNKISFKYINLDQASRDEKREVTIFLKEHNLPIAFPVITIDDNVIQGFDQTEIEKCLPPKS